MALPAQKFSAPAIGMAKVPTDATEVQPFHPVLQHSADGFRASLDFGHGVAFLRLDKSYASDALGEG